MKHAFITIAIPFEARHEQNVRNCIDAELGNPPHRHIVRALNDGGIVHFMSLLVVPAQEGASAHLLMEVSADGERDAAIGFLAGTLRAALLNVLGCAGLPRPESLEKWLEGHALALGQAWWETLGLDFDGTPGMSAQRIRREDALARELTQILAALPAHLAPYERLQAARARLWAQGEHKWAFQPERARCLEGAPDSGITPFVTHFFGDAIPARPFDPLPAVHTVVRMLSSAFVAIAWPLVLMAAVLWWAAAQFTSVLGAAVLVALLLSAVAAATGVPVRRDEGANTPRDREPRSDKVEGVMRHESHASQNLLFSVSDLQPGLLRRLALRVALFSVGLVGLFCRPGFLGGNRVIHFARWLVLPGTDQLVFLSNYDGTWQGYVGDFVINSAGAKGVSAIWSNCLGFPRTVTLFEEGAADRDRLVRWARRQQQPVHFWYSAYPKVSTDQVRLNAAIRQGLANAASAQDARDWLACFGSVPTPPSALETFEIPALAFGGLSRLTHSCILGVCLDDDPAQGRALLADLQGQASFGEEHKRASALSIALSASGLRKLGRHDAQDMATFPVAFQQGMHAPQRARANGDVRQQQPRHWQWGQPAMPVDVLFVLHASDEPALALQLGQLAQQVWGRGHVVSLFRDFEPLRRNAPAVEAFGFVDGVSQPAMRGTGRAATVGPRDVVAAGEFVLGYADELGRCAPSATIHAACDPARWLPDAQLDPNRQRPLFNPADAMLARRDFSRNGSYLVVRELVQHVQAFNAWVDRQSHALRGDDVPAVLAWRRQWLAAKLVGRWHDGSSLVRHPEQPASGWRGRTRAAPDNDFLYAKEDPMGERCPFGSHVRRVNPRDGLDAGSAASTATVQTHRLLRVGRSFVDEHGAKGLMFMCINADIERQFEFVQQRWMLNPSFAALRDEPDPLLGCGTRRGLSLPGFPGRRVRGMADFVTMRGGGYFFLPSRAALAVLARPGPH